MSVLNMWLPGLIQPTRSQSLSNSANSIKSPVNPTYIGRLNITESYNLIKQNLQFIFFSVRYQVIKLFRQT